MGILPQTQDHLQVVMTGHVDHGKSSLLGRLYADAGVIPPSLVARVKDICERQGKAFEHQPARASSGRGASGKRSRRSTWPRRPEGQKRRTSPARRAPDSTRPARMRRPSNL